jgi:Collagen triple helix repeat (20 copies)
MRNRHAGGNRKRHPWPTPPTVISSVALFVALGGSAAAATGLIHAGNLATGAVTSRAIRDGAVEPKDVSTATRAWLRGSTATNGTAGVTGAPGANGVNGVTGAPGTNGANGPAGANGASGTNGPNGANGVDGTNGVNGAKGIDGTNGVDGTNGTNGTNGTISPLSATQGLTALPTLSPSTTVVTLAVPAGNYVVLAKTQLSQTGAGDSVECVLKVGSTTVDQVAMKTLPALAAIPASLQAVIKATSPSQLSVQCDVLVANGSANFSSLIAIPTA